MGFKPSFRGLFFILLTIFLAFETLKNQQNGQKYKEKTLVRHVYAFLG